MPSLRLKHNDKTFGEGLNVAHTEHRDEDSEYRNAAPDPSISADRFLDSEDQGVPNRNVALSPDIVSLIPPAANDEEQIIYEDKFIAIELDSAVTGKSHPVCLPERMNPSLPRPDTQSLERDIKQIMQRALSAKSTQHLKDDTALMRTSNAGFGFGSADCTSDLDLVNPSNVSVEYLTVCPTFLESSSGSTETGVKDISHVEEFGYSAVQELLVSRQYEDGQKRLLEVLQTQESKLGVDDFRAAAIFYIMGIVNTKMEKYEQALELYDCALKIAQNDGARTAWTADIIDNIGRMNVALGKYNLGLKFFQEAKTIKLEIFGATHPKLADSEGSLGEVYLEMGRFNSAVIHYTEGLRICERCFGREHLTTAQMMEDLARTYDLLGEKYVALGLYQDVLGIKLQLTGDQSEIADTLHNMAVTLQSLGSHDLALELFEKAVPIYQRGGRKDARKAANAFKNMAVVHSKQGNHAKEMENLKQALKIEGREFGLHDLNTADTFNNLGVAYGSIGDHKEAIRLYKISLNITKCFRPSTHPAVGDIHHNIGTALLARGKGHEAVARKHFRFSHQNFLGVYGAEHVKSRNARELLESMTILRPATSIIRRNRINVRRNRRFRRQSRRRDC